MLLATYGQTFLQSTEKQRSVSAETALIRRRQAPLDRVVSFHAVSYVYCLWFWDAGFIRSDIDGRRFYCLSHIIFTISVRSFAGA